MSSGAKQKLLSSTAAPPRSSPTRSRRGSRCRNAPTPSASGAMPRAKMEEPKRARRRAAQTPIRAGPDPSIESTLALSIKQFCRERTASASKRTSGMQRAGIGPAVMKVGSRTMISVEAAAAWRREREEAARKQRGERIATEPEATA